MSQNMGKPVNEGQGISGRSGNERRGSDNRERYEGFEGMNYEQKRGPYNPMRTSGNARNDENVSNNSDKRRDDL
jgi:hypothetical protein